MNKRAYKYLNRVLKRARRNLPKKMRGRAQAADWLLMSMFELDAEQFPTQPEAGARLFYSPAGEDWTYLGSMVAPISFDDSGDELG